MFLAFVVALKFPPGTVSEGRAPTRNPVLDNTSIARAEDRTSGGLRGDSKIPAGAFTPFQLFGLLFGLPLINASIWPKEYVRES